MKDKFLLFLQIFFNFCRIVTTFLRLLSNIHKCLMDKHFLHKSLLHKLFLHKRLLDKLLLDKLFLDKYYRHKNFLTEISLTHIDSGHVKLDTNVSDRNFLTHLVLTVLWYSLLMSYTNSMCQNVGGLVLGLILASIPSLILIKCPFLLFQASLEDCHDMRMNQVTGNSALMKRSLIV